MGRQYGLVVDLDRCTGCYACEVGCAQWHDVPSDRKWITLKTIGPERINGKLRLDLMPIATEECTLCGDRLKEGLAPLCVVTCTTQALAFGDDRKLLELLSSGKRYQLSKFGVPKCNSH
jgi:Fe-S-cluster-containing dehydrogenase component